MTPSEKADDLILEIYKLPISNEKKLQALVVGIATICSIEGIPFAQAASVLLALEEDIRADDMKRGAKGKPS